MMKRDWLVRVGSLCVLLGVSMPVEGLAQERFDPSVERMGVGDRTAAAGMLPRVWAVSIDQRLLSRAVDVSLDGWTPHSQTGLSSDVDVASIVTGGIARQRVFYVRGGSLRMLNWDDDIPGAESTLPAAAYTLSNSVSALGWIEGANLRMAVAVEAASGRVCVWEGTIAGGFSGAPTCTATNSMGTTGSIDGAVVGSAAFFYVNGSDQLVRLRRVSAGSWSPTNLGRPAGTATLGNGIAVLQNLDGAGRHEAIVEGSGRLWRCSVTSSENACFGLWGSLPTPPAGSTVSADREALSAVRYFVSGTARMSLFATTAELRLLRLRSTSTAWDTSWQASNGGSANGPVNESVYGASVAVALANGSSDRPTTYLWTGSYALFVAAYGLHEYSEEGNYRDHIRRNHDYVRRDGVAGDTAGDVLGYGRPDPGSTSPLQNFDANESSVYTGSIFGLASALRRNSPAPWEVVVSTTLTGGSSWDSDWVVTPTPLTVPTEPGIDRMSMTDPYSAGLPNSSTLYHLGLEVPIRNTGVGTCESVTGLRRLVIRRGTGAQSIAAISSLADPNLFLVSEDFGLDHGQLVATVSGASADLHVVYQRAGLDGRYWRRTAAGTVTDVAVFGASPPGAFAGDGTRVWAYSGTGLANLCQVNPTITNCGSLNQNSVSPSPIAVNVRFGSTGPVDHSVGRHIECMVPGMPGVARFCYDTAQPVAYAGSPTTAAVYAVYQADDPADPGNETSIFFNRTAGSLTNDWRDAIRIRTRPHPDMLEIQPSITVDHEGTILVTFSETYQDLVSPIVVQRLFISINDGVSFTEVPSGPLPNWRPSSLPLHCSRGKYFLGEYRDGSRLGGRAFQLVHRDDGFGSHTLTGFWSSRWARF